MKRSAVVDVRSGVVVAFSSVRARAAGRERPSSDRTKDAWNAQIRSWIHEQKQSRDDRRAHVRRRSLEARGAFVAHSPARASRERQRRRSTRCDALLAARRQNSRESSSRASRARARDDDGAFGVEDVTVAPPPPQVEVQGTAPSPNHRWLPGYWQWNGSRHVWQAGHWAEPPEPGMLWEAPKWENHGGKWAFADGRWHLASPAAATVVYEPPSTPKCSSMPATARTDRRSSAGGSARTAFGFPVTGSGTEHGTFGFRAVGRRRKPGCIGEPDHWEHRGNQWALVHGRWARLRRSGRWERESRRHALLGHRCIVHGRRSSRLFLLRRKVYGWSAQGAPPPPPATSTPPPPPPPEPVAVKNVADRRHAHSHSARARFAVDKATFDDKKPNNKRSSTRSMEFMQQNTHVHEAPHRRSHRQQRQARSQPDALRRSRGGGGQVAHRSRHRRRSHPHGRFRRHEAGSSERLGGAQATEPPNRVPHRRDRRQAARPAPSPRPRRRRRRGSDGKRRSARRVRQRGSSPHH